MFSRSLLAAIGLIQLVNGLFMIVDAEGWYGTVPGVSQTGPINHHFIIDIGLAFIVSGSSIVIGLRTGRAAATCALIGATWPALHALFHKTFAATQESVAIGAARRPSRAIRQERTST